MGFLTYYLEKRGKPVYSVKVPDKKDNGTIRKFVTVAIWSNFSYNPAIIPTT